MEKKYNHVLVEEGLQQKWSSRDWFTNHDDTRPPFCIILPPPNITGVLHMGHALNIYLQDSIVRYKQLRGYDVLFLPCMDHAGIATQAKIDELLNTQGITRHDIGRDKFLQHAQEWQNVYQQRIREQWNRLGTALDFNNERYTLDDDAYDYVLQTFVKMYHDKLIYRDTKAVAWDCSLKTALSNIEIDTKIVRQKLYYIKYRISNSEKYISIATTRPETLYSDVAVAIHPDDKRSAELLLHTIIHPLTKKEMPIITDEAIDMNFGSGCMKVSAHALEDIEIIKKHRLELRETISEEGVLYNVPEKFIGLNREMARERIIEELIRLDMLLDTKDTVSQIGYSQRSGTPIEILVKKQWFVRMQPLAEKLLQNLDQNGVRFWPRRFKQSMRVWMENIHDWTISRQLWWGHRIPAWYKQDEVLVQTDSPGKEWVQEEDVLDTWFSSALAPMSFLGASNSKLYNKFFPTNILVTAYDITNFWVARMYFQSLYLTGTIPFKEVLIHGLIRDSEGRKMSKSLGNGINPMNIIDKYGSDALRLFLLFNSSPGKDIKFSIEKVESAWNFLNKLWNIIRFVKQRNSVDNIYDNLDMWIEYKLQIFQKRIAKHMQKYEFALIYKEIHEMIMDTLSSQYLEFSKVYWHNKKILSVLNRILLELHPFLPHITDFLYRELFQSELLDNSIVTDKEIRKGQWEIIENINIIIKAIRNFRQEKLLGNKTILKIWLKRGEITGSDKRIIEGVTNSIFEENNGVLLREPAFELWISHNEVEQDSVRRHEQQLSFLRNEIARCEGLLSNQGFLAKAPDNLVNLEREKLRKYSKQLEELEDI